MHAVVGLVWIVSFTFPVVLLEGASRYCGRLASFPTPDFVSNFTLRSQNGRNSFREIRHGLGVEPFYVRVYAKPKKGPNSGFCFDGVGGNQASATGSSSYGGLIFAYNSEFVRIWAPTNSKGFIIFIKDGWGGEQNAQQASKAVVFVEIWRTGPEPNFQIDSIIGNGTIRGSYGEVDHRLRQIPDRIVVRVAPESHSSPNGGFWFNAISASQNSNPGYGGVIFAFNERIVRLWAPNLSQKQSGCILVNELWGGGEYAQRETRCRVNVQIWVNQYPVPAHQTDWFKLRAQGGDSSFKEITHNLGKLPESVNIQIKPLSGMNALFIYQAQGSVQSDDDNSKGYGGVAYAYDEHKVRIWTASRNDGSKLGYTVLVKHGWGGDLFLENGTSEAMVRVLVYGSKCNGSEETLYQENTCVRTSYEAYGWLTTPWSGCSSICNTGHRTRKSTGCQVTSKMELAVSCDFENDMCGWTTSSQTLLKMNWRRTNATTPTANTGPLWGHPKGSFYVYTYSVGVFPEGYGYLDSPSVHGRTKCHLTFYWNMFGRDVGTLSVLVSKWGGGWVETGWSMSGTQGPIYWRSAYLNLERFTVYRIRFEHMLPKRPAHCSTCPSQSSLSPKCLECKACPGNTCPLGNVAIDNVKLMCEDGLHEEPPKLCGSRSLPLAGCEQGARIRNKELQGPAYAEDHLPAGPDGSTIVYVVANGSKSDIVGTYQLNIEFTADYVLWLNVYSTDGTNNDIEFQVDEGGWNRWRVAYKTSHHLWHVYRFKLFRLHQSPHSITFRQDEKGFRFNQLIMAPKALSTWADLGMQSRHIPDSHLTAYPSPGSQPKPKYGRLNAVEGWCSSDFNKGHVYFQVVLPNLALLSRIAIQGGKDIFKKSNDYWLKSFRLKVSLDMHRYTWYRDRSGTQKEFVANGDAASVSVSVLPFVVPVRAVRIYPWDWENWICMRTELYGIYLSSAMCATAGMEPPSSTPCTGNRDCGANAQCQPDTVRRRSKRAANPRSLFSTSPSPSPSPNTTVIQESCHCLPGYHGDGCQHYGCSPNPCDHNGTCAQTSNSSAFFCACADGYYGSICQHPCPAGRYGKSCMEKCLCTEFGSCDVVTGKCHCLPGYSGTRCQYECPTGYYGYNCAQKCQCVNGASCDRRTGACNCTVGWTGAFCQQPCPHNTWGEGCVKNCSCSAAALTCSRTTGECVCPPGWRGRYCEDECPDGFYGRGCTYPCMCAHNQLCSKRDGVCDCTIPGVTGMTCGQPCRAGYYGVDCKYKCACLNGGDCGRVAGQCTCAAGWTGSFCSTPCPHNTWGYHCLLTSNCTNGARTDAVTGQCTCVRAAGCSCDAGWTGKSCRDPCGSDRWGPGCSNACQCSSNGECDRITGKCKCRPGNTGDRCQSSCNQGNYGVNCSSNCSCNANVSQACDVTSGLCQCKPGWRGWSCDLPCLKGSWGLQCSNTCTCRNGSCDPANGHCTCNRGWAGQNCDQPCRSCGAPCPTCYHSNGSCDAATGKCVCKAGYQGDACLEACSVGYYGNGCNDKCLCVHGNCHPATGSCDCQPGWTGERCDKGCPSNKFGYNCTQQCACVHGICNATDGSCQCNSGYHGNLCDRPCPAGLYGTDCRLKCPCENGAGCDPVGGRCTCGTGWTGSSCNISCSAGRYGGDCQERCKCKSCDRFTGRCRCPAGYQGFTCTQTCRRGYYGNNCSQSCACVNNGKCGHVNGTCTCTPGWAGPRCDDPCPAGRYGLKCASTCRCNPNVTEVTRPCDHVTGQCNCRPGYQGLRCLEQCPEGSYGNHCTGRCRCQNGGQCRFTDGSCLCQPGYHGNRCELTCPQGRYGVNCSSSCQCIHGNTQSCDRVDGSCTCADGYIGVLCENPCSEGNYGGGCHGNCSCFNGAPCDYVTGTCTCTAGFKGQECRSVCEEGTFGPGCTQKCLCENGAACNRATGVCSCAPGYTGQRCSQSCPEGRYGVKCVNICDCNTSNTKRCDFEDGTCHCKLGYTNRRCDKQCPDGRYGQDCRMACPECSRHVTGPCNKQHGNCTCAAGFHGYQCYDVCARDSYGLKCLSTCSCSQTLLCDHVKGTCHRYRHGLFSVIINETFALFDTVNRRRDLRLGLENLMDEYYDEARSTLGSGNQVRREAQTKLKDENGGGGQAASLAIRSTPTPSQRPTIAVSRSHDFLVRLLQLESVQLTEKISGVRAVCVLIDKGIIMNASTVSEVLRGIPREKISNEIAAPYYTGELYTPPLVSAVKLNLPSIIGASVGVFLVILILVIFKLMRHRYYARRRSANYRKAKKDHAEFELQPCIGPGSNSYLLAFDNPYYDILAAMGLDDDVEEEYYNPLYDDISVCSDSYNSNTDDSCHKDLSHMVLR